jgi:hypothetical protein
MKKLLSLLVTVLALVSIDASRAATTNYLGTSPRTNSSFTLSDTNTVIVSAGRWVWTLPWGVIRTNFQTVSNGLVAAYQAADLTQSNLSWWASRTNNTPLDFQHNSGVSGDHMVLGGRAGKTITNLYVQAVNAFEIQAPVTRMTGSLNVAGSSLVGAARKALIVQTNGDVAITNAGVLEWSYFVTNDPPVLYLGSSEAGTTVSNLYLWPGGSLYGLAETVRFATRSNLTHLQINGDIRLSHDSGNVVFLDENGVQLPVVNNSLLPALDNNFSLGSPTEQWFDIYSSGVSYLADVEVTGTVTASRFVSTTTGPGSIQLMLGTNAVVSQSTNFVVDCTGGDFQWLSVPSGGVNLMHGTNLPTAGTNSTITLYLPNFTGSAQRFWFPSTWNAHGSATTNAAMLPAGKVHVFTINFFGNAQTNSICALSLAN